MIAEPRHDADTARDRAGTRSTESSRGRSRPRAAAPRIRRHVEPQREQRVPELQPVHERPRVQIPDGAETNRGIANCDTVTSQREILRGGRSSPRVHESPVPLDRLPGPPRGYCRGSPRADSAACRAVPDPRPPRRRHRRRPSSARPARASVRTAPSRPGSTRIFVTSSRASATCFTSSYPVVGDATDTCARERRERLQAADRLPADRARARDALQPALRQRRVDGQPAHLQARRRAPRAIALTPDPAADRPAPRQSPTSPASCRRGAGIREAHAPSDAPTDRQARSR